MDAVDDVGAYLRSRGEVFFDGGVGPSKNATAGVMLPGGDRYFVKWTTDAESVAFLQSAVRFHARVAHRAIVPLVGWFEVAGGMAIVHEWRDGVVLADDALRSSLPVDALVGVVSTVLDAHVAVVAAGFVAVDFYDQSMLWCGDHVELCDLDMYRPGPYVLDVDRQYGSSRFMAPEESRRGATVDERTTVFTMGRTAYVLLSVDRLGEPSRASWRAGDATFAVARRATEAEPGDRWPSVEAMAGAWNAAVAGAAVPYAG